MLIMSKGSRELTWMVFLALFCVSLIAITSGAVIVAQLDTDAPSNVDKTVGGEGGEDASTRFHIVVKDTAEDDNGSAGPAQLSPITSTTTTKSPSKSHTFNSLNLFAYN